MAEEFPNGCPGCNPEGILPFIEKRGIKADEVPVPRHKWNDVLICDDCGRAWLTRKKETSSGQ